jgi:GTP cyclohydrolase I
MCEHHLLPFSCSLTMGYLPRGGKILGLSKFGRIAQLAAHKLQLQERLTQEIASELSRITESEDVAVLGEGVHLCMLMRGAKAEHVMASSAIRGAFRHEPETRAEFFHLAKGGGG